MAKNTTLTLAPKQPLGTRFVRAFKQNWQLYSLLVVPVGYLIIFRYIPMLGNVIALRHFTPGGSMFGDKWMSELGDGDLFYYFKRFMSDPTFWKIFKNTVFLGFETLIFTFPLPIIFALLLNEVTGVKFKKFVQTASYLPHFLSMVIISGMILQLTGTNGTFNNIIEALGGHKIIFFQDPKWFHPIYIISQAWQGLGWGAILYLAALTNIDPALYEAAVIDGANRWKQTLHVTIPGILPTIITLLVLNIGSFMAVGFEKVLLLQNPSIYSTADVISTYLYRLGIMSGSFSYAAAIGIFNSVIGLVLVLFSNWLSKKITNTSLW
ncbi:sugar ABC transporter permease [Lactococcus hodotermopsidis]|uniref:Sugar ABC transporter permease n=1 Tax=Pseudolactococcus hodotermopsidis TaxID=2709157 RepID=A0A6A0BBK5_9LACT|nr:ABC transporter permease subunit [Lactococcus hodotermopsidis]GFH42063.1 sugar ABC transporter permease [Lactococcus hodotermopsidis]